MNSPAIKPKTSKRGPTPAFIARAERSFRRVAQQVRAENKQHGLPLAVWGNGASVTRNG